MISHHHKCIFVHIPKNAGQSIEHVFLDLLDLTWETRAPLLLRNNDKTELGPPRLAHLKAKEYVPCKYLTHEQFDSYFKFAIVRNPWDRLVSFYKYFGYTLRMDFKTFVIKEFRENVWTRKYWFVAPQTEFVCDDEGKIIVNYIGRFEKLQNDFDYVCEALNLPKIEVPRVNVSKKTHQEGSKERAKKAFQRFKQVFRHNSLPALTRRVFKSIYLRVTNKPYPLFDSYKDYYDEETRGLAAKMYKTDIDLFGYTFEKQEPDLPESLNNKNWPD